MEVMQGIAEAEESKKANDQDILVKGGASPLARSDLACPRSESDASALAS
jgi:hypothetical protein